jgi:hypothetical protein
MNAGSKNNEFMKTTGPSTTCAEFQDQLPELFESGADLKEQEHLKTCEQCCSPFTTPARPCGRTSRPRSPRESRTPARDRSNERRPPGVDTVACILAHAAS